MRQVFEPAIEELCSAFEKGGYSPTPVVDLGVLVANADGKINEPERELLSEVFQALLEAKLPSEVIDALISASVEVISIAGDEARTRLIGEILMDCDAGEQALRVALVIAFASEGLSDKERVVIDRIAAASGVEPEQVDQLIAEVKKYTDEGGPTSARAAILNERR